MKNTCIAAVMTAVLLQIAWTAEVDFSYESNKVKLQVVAEQNVDQIKIVEITYESPKGGRVPAYLVRPAGKRPFAGILYQHWGNGEKTEFIAEAIILAKAGSVSLLVDAPFVRPKEWRKEGGLTKPDGERASMIQAIVDWRRGFDLLLQEYADPKRLAFVGIVTVQRSAEFWPELTPESVRLF
jgi:cephalosporin-C deacetylase-like acetyl esterase